MQVCKSLSEIESYCKTKYGLVIGNFDGVHLGHEKMLLNFVKSCRLKKITPVVITFSPHPRLYFAQENLNFLLSDQRDKYSKFENLGVSFVVELDFTSSIQSLSATQFLKEYITSNSRVELVYLGHDFKLGSGKENAKHTLKKLAEGQNILIEEENALLYKGRICSSSLIRKKLIEQGAISDAKKLLGYKYSITGGVEEGKGIGKKELFSTINIKWPENRLVPKMGVYITRSIIKNKIYESITNIGCNPTISNDNKQTVETHVFDFDETIYEQEVEVIFEKRIRDEVKFSSLDDLKQQIQRDIEVAKRFFKDVPPIKLALIGKNISHSKSQSMYEKIFMRAIDYKLLDFNASSEIPLLSELKSKFSGVSITSPYKKHFLNEVDGKEFESINCIDLKKINYPATNTDYFAIKEILDRYLSLGIKQVYILGDGAMSSLVKKSCTENSLRHSVHSRKLGNLTEDKLNIISPDDLSTLVINTCAREYQFPKNLLGKYHFWDLNYELEHHRSLFSTSQVVYEDGMAMLGLQAKYAVSFWNQDKI